MDESLDKIRQANAARAETDLKMQMHNQQLDSDASLQRVLLSAFQSLTNVIENNGDKKEALSIVANAFDRLNSTMREGHTDLGDIKSTLKVLESKVSSIPTDPLKDMPNFPEHPGTVEVSNLESLETKLDSLEAAIKAQKLSVKAPDVHVASPDVKVSAPDVHVPALNLAPLESIISDIKTALDKLKTPSVQKTEQQNTLINEKFDEYKIVYGGKFDDDDDTRVSSTQYFLAGKKVATLKYNYDKDGNLTGVKKA